VRLQPSSICGFVAFQALIDKFLHCFCCFCFKLQIPLFFCIVLWQQDNQTRDKNTSSKNHLWGGNFIFSASIWSSIDLKSRRLPGIQFWQKFISVRSLFAKSVGT